MGFLSRQMWRRWQSWVCRKWPLCQNDIFSTGFSWNKNAVIWICWYFIFLCRSWTVQNCYTHSNLFFSFEVCRLIIQYHHGLVMAWLGSSPCFWGLSAGLDKEQLINVKDACGEFKKSLTKYWQLPMNHNHNLATTIMHNLLYDII